MSVSSGGVGQCASPLSYALYSHEVGVLEGAPLLCAAHYSPECVEGKFSEVLGLSRIAFCGPNHANGLKHTKLGMASTLLIKANLPQGGGAKPTDLF